MLKRAGLLLAGLACALVIAPAASPVQLAYVYSDSMEPTIGQSDGFVLLPAGEVQRGDIVTFRSESRDAYVTHRVVGRTENGFTTKGDNNPTTDQAAGYPAVQRDDIVGKVLNLQGDPLVVPGLGSAVRFIHGHRGFVAALLGIALVGGFLRQRTPSRPSRSVPRVRSVLWPIFAIALVSSVAFQLTGGTSKQLTYVAVESDIGGANTLRVGESTTDSVVINQSTIPLTTAVISAEGMTITNTSGNESTVTATLRVPPPTRPGVVTTEVHVSRYLTVLPPAVIQRLHGIHPLVAAIATAVTALGPIALTGFLVIDGKRPIRSVESRWQRLLRRRWRET